jgi:hypothetical protein
MTVVMSSDSNWTQQWCQGGVRQRQQQWREQRQLVLLLLLDLVLLLPLLVLLVRRQPLHLLLQFPHDTSA